MMSQLIKKAAATLLSLTMILCWTAFAKDVKVNAGSYATASFVRVYGSDRYDTANQIAAQGWDTTPAVVLASGTSYPDALAGAPLAYALDAPILLVSGSSVPDSVMKQILDLGATRIYILGGTAAVSSSIEYELTSKNFTVERIWGQTRYETAVEVAKALMDITGPSTEAFVVSGENYPDALAISPVASLYGAPIVYSNKKGSIDSGSAALLAASGADTAYVIGGTAAISDLVRSNLSKCGIGSITRISGESRYDTALKVADHFIDVFTAKSLAFATGENYPDALAGGVFAAKKGMPVLLTNSKLNADESSSIFLTASAYDNSLSFTENLVDFIDRFGPEEVFVFGGENAVPNVTIDSYFEGDTWSGNDNTASSPPAHQGYTVGGYVYESYEPIASGNVAEYGNPIHDVTVAIAPYSTGDGIDVGNSSIIYRTTDNNGFFCAEDLNPGQYYIRLSKEGYETGSYPLDLTENVTDLKFFMYSGEHDSTGTVCGYAMHNGKAISNIDVYLSEGYVEDYVVSSTKTDSNGYFSFDVEAGDYVLYATDHYEYESDTYSVSVQNGKTVRCDLELIGEETSLTLVSVYVYLNGEPVSGATVEISYTSTITGESDQISLETNSRGYIWCWIDDAEECDIYASYSDSHSTYVSNVKTAALTGDSVDCNLNLYEADNGHDESEGAATVYGYVKLDGESMSGLTVTLTDYYSILGADRTTVTDSDGYYIFTDVPVGGLYSVEVNDFKEGVGPLVGSNSDFTVTDNASHQRNIDLIIY